MSAASGDMEMGAPSREALLQVYKDIVDDITRYRNLEWQVPSIVVTFLFALAATAGNEKISELLHHYLRLRWSFSLVIFTLLVMVCSFLWFTEDRLEQARNNRTRLQRELNIFGLVEFRKTPLEEYLDERLEWGWVKFFLSVGFLLMVAFSAALTCWYLVWLK
jgi:hypothetical protein